ncbi:MAG: alpha/beta hydrolase [Chloroflexi bacterium HGW-Chloroflexi-10]|nr:MAG: alpha/beta hydrolase [Chloroflexi bacterium HGW-Chloroflexi-10]
MTLQEQFIQVNGYKTHYFSNEGSGPTLLFLHGAGIDSGSLSWRPFLEILAEKNYRIIAPDLPGYGDSERPDIAFNTNFFIRFVGSLLDTLKLEKVTLIGLSMGGAISLGTALSWPQRVERLVLVGSYGIQRKVSAHFLSWLMVKTPGILEGTWILTRKSRKMAEWSMVNVFHNPKTMDPKLMDEICLEIGKPFPGRTFTRHQRDDMLWNGLRTNYLSQLEKIQIPTLLFHGRYDAGVPVACAIEAHQLIKGSQLYISEDAGHWAQREKPEEFMQVLTQFLEQTGPR